jgi:hypothetical protein
MTSASCFKRNQKSDQLRYVMSGIGRLTAELLSASAISAKLAGRTRARRPITASHDAPRAQPKRNPAIAGQVRLARWRALAIRLGFCPRIISPISVVRSVIFVVSTAVDGAPTSEIRTSAFWTAIAETPSIPARTMLGALASTPEPATTHIPRKPQSNASCRNRRNAERRNATSLETCSENPCCDKCPDEYRDRYHQS